jgi:cytochrome P450
MSHGESVKTKRGGPPVSFHSAEFFANPYATYDLLRETDPVHWSDELGRWVLTRYEDAIRVLRGTQFTSRPEHHRVVFRYLCRPRDYADRSSRRCVVLLPGAGAPRAPASLWSA